MRKRIEQLDGLRGIFSVFVIAHHHNAFKSSIFYNNFFVINSSLFVDFFFVLSGFVIAINYIDTINTKQDFIQFIKKRFFRLYPLLFYTEIVFLIANLFGDHSTLKNASDLSFSYYFLTVLDTLTFMGSTPIFGGWMGLNYPAWSISSEMIAYVIFGMVLLLWPHFKNLAFIVIIVFSTIFTILYGEYMLSYDYGFIRGTLCFSIGVLTFQTLKERELKLSFWEIPYLIILVLLMYCTHFYEWNLMKLIFPIWFAVGIMVFANSNGIIKQILTTKAFQYLGRISYSIYLNHAIVLIAVNILLFRILKAQPTEVLIGFSLLISIVLTIIYSHFTYLWVETRLGQYLKNKFL